MVFHQSDGYNKSIGSARVQLLGIEAGELLLDHSTEKPSFLFYPNKKIRSKHPELPDSPWKWSKDGRHGQAIREFLKLCESHPKAKPDNEREIQWQLAHAFKKDKSGALRGFQTVKWHGLFTEIGVSVTESGKLGTGNIDLVVRRGKGGQRGFLVFELKKPGDTKIEAALIQALQYATALHIEVNNGGLGNQENYRKVFGAGGTKKLKISAVIVMEDDTDGRIRRDAPDIMKRYSDNRGDSPIDRLGVLLYTFKGKVTSWQWLKGWDARTPP